MPTIEAGIPKVTAANAVYVELKGARKDADCSLVDVRGGVSSQKGCCDLFYEKPDADNFHCGDCIYVRGRGQSMMDVPLDRLLKSR